MLRFAFAVSIIISISVFRCCCWCSWSLLRQLLRVWLLSLLWDTEKRLSQRYRKIVPRRQCKLENLLALSLRIIQKRQINWTEREEKVNRKFRKAKCTFCFGGKHHRNVRTEFHFPEMVVGIFSLSIYDWITFHIHIYYLKLFGGTKKIPLCSSLSLNALFSIQKRRDDVRVTSEKNGSLLAFHLINTFCLSHGK